MVRTVATTPSVGSGTTAFEGEVGPHGLQGAPDDPHRRCRRGLMRLGASRQAQGHNGTIPRGRGHGVWTAPRRGTRPP